MPHLNNYLFYNYYWNRNIFLSTRIIFTFMKYIFFLLFLFSSSAFGCSCAFPTIEDSYQNSDAIFIGKVIAVD